MNNTITAIFAVLVVAYLILLTYVCIANEKLKKYIDTAIDKKDTALANIAMSVAKLEKEVEDIKLLPDEKLEEIENEVLTRASKKIDAGIDSILNYDPFSAMGQNEEAE